MFKFEMKINNKRVVLLLVIATLLHSVVDAYPQFKDKIPNGYAYSRFDSGIQCEALGHSNCIPGAPRNPFGLDFKAAGLRWTKELCEKDSDGDGLTNGEELGDPCCEWSEENPSAVRLTMLSHPGRSDLSGASAAPKCEVSSSAPNRPTSFLPEPTTVPSTVAPANPTVLPTPEEPVATGPEPRPLVPATPEDTEEEEMATATLEASETEEVDAEESASI